MGVSIDIYNISGQCIFSKQYLSEKYTEQIDLSSFANGIYTLKIVSDNKIKTSKLVISK